MNLWETLDMLIAHPAFVPGVLTGIFFVVLYVGFLIEASRGDDAPPDMFGGQWEE